MTQSLTGFLAPTIPHVSTADVDNDEFNKANQLEIRVRRWMDNERYDASDESITAIIHKARVNFASNSECSSYIGD